MLVAPELEHVAKIFLESAYMELIATAADVDETRPTGKPIRATLFSQLSGAGAPTDEARRSVELLTAAVSDFESFANLNPGEGLQKIQSALAGEVEPLRRFGIELSAARIDEKLRANGVAAGDSASGLDQLRARIGLLLDDFKRLNILSDVERTAGGFANQIRAIGGAVVDLRGTSGTAFLPALESITPTLTSSIRAATELIETYPILTQVTGDTGASLLGFGTAATIAGIAVLKLDPLVAAGAKAFVTMAGAIAGVSSLPVVALATAAGFLIYAIGDIQGSYNDLSASVDRVSAAYESYAEQVREASQYRPEQAFEASEEAETKLAKTLQEVSKAQRQLNDLQQAGKGNSNEAANLRSRIPILVEQARFEGDSASEAAAKADPVLASRDFRDATRVLGEEIAALDAAIAATDPSRENAVAILQSKRVGKLRALKDLEAAADPAVSLIDQALTNQVASGTAADPEKRLAELKVLIREFELFYRRNRNSAEADRFRALGGRADATVPSRASPGEQPRRRRSAASRGRAACRPLPLGRPGRCRSSRGLDRRRSPARAEAYRA